MASTTITQPHDASQHFTHADAVAYVLKVLRETDHEVRAVHGKPHHLVDADGCRIYVTMGHVANAKSFVLPERGEADVIAFALWRGKRFVECCTWGSAAALSALVRKVA
jgi:hypothetical protein